MPLRVQLEAAHVDEAALGVATHRVLDLDDVGAPVGEDGSRRGNEGELRNLEDPHALHHLDHDPPSWSVCLDESSIGRSPNHPAASNVTGIAVGERNGWPVDVRVVVGDELDVGQPVEQAFERDPGLHPGQVQSHAGVLAGGKRDVGQALPEDVELLGALPSAFVAVRRADADVDHRARGKRHAFELGVLRRVPLHGGQRRLEPQTLLDGGRDELAVGLHRHGTVRDGSATG